MFEIKPASRVGINPLIEMYSESGCGKTYSALLLARGLAGPKGKIVVADSESRRASLYADVLPELVEAASRFVKSQATVERLRTVSCGEKLEAAEQDFIDASLQLSAAIARAEEIKDAESK